MPTGIVVQCQNDRSQHRNRAEAMAMLKSRLYEAEMRKRQAEQDKLESSKTDVGWGHQIRSYVLDQSRIKDLRTNVEMSNTKAVLDGDLDDFISASLKQGVSAAARPLGRAALPVCVAAPIPNSDHHDRTDPNAARRRGGRKPDHRRAPRQAARVARARRRVSERFPADASRRQAPVDLRRLGQGCARSEPGRGVGRRPHDAQARDGQGQLRDGAGRFGPHPVLRDAERRRRGNLRRVQEVGPRRHRRRARRLFRTKTGELSVQCKELRCWRRRCARCRTSSTASPTRKCASATST
jgi:hypothetical protein